MGRVDRVVLKKDVGSLRMLLVHNYDGVWCAWTWNKKEECFLSRGELFFPVHDQLHAQELLAWSFSRNELVTIPNSRSNGTMYSDEGARWAVVIGC